MFGFEDKQVKVVGTVEGSLTLDCSRCNLPVGCDCSLPIDVLVFESEDRLQSWLDHVRFGEQGSRGKRAIFEFNGFGRR